MTARATKGDGESQNGSEGDREGDREGGSVSDSEGDGDGKSEGEGEGDSGSVSDSEGEGDREGDREGGTGSDGKSEGDGEGDGKSEGDGDSEGEGRRVIAGADAGWSVDRDASRPRNAVNFGGSSRAPKRFVTRWRRTSGAPRATKRVAVMMTPSTPFTPIGPFAPYALPSVPEKPKLTAEAISRLVTELAPRVLCVTRAILGRGHPEVEDAYQQGMLELIGALPSFRGDCEPIHFASRIAARVALAIARRSRTARSRREEGADVELMAVEGDLEEDLAHTRRMDLLRDLLARLPEEQAETLTLRVVLGWTLPEVAAATGAPLNTVRSRIRLAKNALRSAVEASPVLAEGLARTGR